MTADSSIKSLQDKLSLLTSCEEIELDQTEAGIYGVDFSDREEEQDG